MERSTVDHTEDGMAATDAKPGSGRQPRPDKISASRVNPDHPRPATLAEQHANGSPIQLEVFRPQRQRLADADATPIKDGDQRPVPDAHRTVPAYRQEPPDLSLAKHLRRK